MKYGVFGTSGVRVSKLALGTATLGVAPLEEDADSVIGRALDLGINVFDCANSYGNQTRFDRPSAPPADQRKSAEEILGKILAPHRNEVLICTKVMERVKPGPNGGGFDGGGLTRLHMMQQVEESLRRLGTDHIDFYHAHHSDPTTPVEQYVRTFDDLVHQGKIRYWMLSTFPAWQVADVMHVAERNNLYAPIGHQISYSLLSRLPERDLIPVAQRFGLGNTVLGPLGGGLLASLQVLERDFAGSARWGGRGFTEEQIETASKLHSLAQETGYKAAHLALGWLTSQPTIGVAIIGPENVSELEENAEAGDLEIPADIMARIDEIGRLPRPGF